MSNNLEKVADFAQQVHGGNKDGHAFDHIQRVVALAKKILVTEPSADKNLVLTAAYLHDSYDEKITSNISEQKAKVEKFLHDLGYQEDEISKIFYIIDNMSFSENLTGRKVLDINGQIVQDADRLEAMGATMIVRSLEYGWAHNRELYNPNIPPQIYSDKADYHNSAKSTTINHFYEKGFLLKDLLNTKKAKEMGKVRDQIMHDFVQAYEREWQDAHDNS